MRSQAVSFYKKPWISVPNKNCDNLWTKNSVDKGMLNNKIMEDKYMTQENKSRLIKFL